MSRSLKKSRSKKVNRRNMNLDLIWQNFSPDILRSICQMPERAFAKAFDMEVTPVAQSWPNDFYAFKDNGSKILAVAHLDTVAGDDARSCNFLNTADGMVVYSRALDDRLGAYIILDMLPRLGINVDLLLTVGEESGQSTADYFQTDKDYNWIIEFDRGGTDVVGYQFEDSNWRALVKESGAKVGDGIFSDIAFLEHLGVKAFNWGVGYQDYHSARSHAFLDDTFEMLSYFMDFHAMNEDSRLKHTERASVGYGRYGTWTSKWDNKWDEDPDKIDLDDDVVEYKDPEDAEIRAWWENTLKDQAS